MNTLRYHDGQAYIEASPENPFPVTVPSADVTLTTKQVSVGTTATLIAAANASRRSIKITNITGTAAVYIRPDSQVSTSNGDYLASGAGSYVVYTGSDALYGVAASAQTVAVAEESAL